MTERHRNYEFCDALYFWCNMLNKLLTSDKSQCYDIVNKLNNNERCSTIRARFMKQSIYTFMK